MANLHSEVEKWLNKALKRSNVCENVYDIKAFRCVVAGNFLVCGLIDVLYVVDVTHGTVNELQKSVGFSIRYVFRFT